MACSLVIVRKQCEREETEAPFFTDVVRRDRKPMDVVKLQYNRRDCKELLSHLMGHVFHLTTTDSYDQIIKSGRIANNKNGQFGINTGSERSYGRLNGRVCFFDLRAKTEDIVEDIRVTYDFLGPTWFMTYYEGYIEWNLAYFILHPNYYSQLIPYEKAVEDFNSSGKWLQAVPHQEAWIEHEVPLNWISKTLRVQIREDAPEKGSLASAHYKIELRRQRKGQEKSNL